VTAYRRIGVSACRRVGEKAKVSLIKPDSEAEGIVLVLVVVLVLDLWNFGAEKRARSLARDMQNSRGRARAGARTAAAPRASMPLFP